MATAKLFWLRMLFREFPVLSAAPTLWCNNVGALALASNPVFDTHIKHIEVDVHFIREKQGRAHVLTKGGWPLWF